MPKSRSTSDQPEQSVDAESHQATSPTGEQVTPLDGNEFLQANRSNRDKYRAEAEAKAAERLKAEKERVAALVSDGIVSLRTTYSDGGQNAIFAALLQKGENLGDVSRPEALAYAGKEVIVVPARKPAPKPVMVALAGPALPPGVIADVPHSMTLAPIAGGLPMLATGLAPVPAGAPVVVSLVKVRADPL